jgi:2-polyprenyl-6-methoxyphenol hydroxylase-like FAD-dependent oxidoreductase
MLKDKKILLLEGGPEKKFNLSPKYSNRVSALSEATRSLMMEIGAWSVIENARFSTVYKILYYETLGLFSDNFRCGKPALKQY